MSSSNTEDYQRIIDRMAQALKASGRAADSVILTAVSKTQPWERIEPVLAAGQRRFGENRVQEAMERWEGQREAWPGLELRLIGPLQSNKAADAVSFFDVIETIDRDKIARAIADEVQKQGRSPELLVQVNIGEEEQKAGILPLDADAFIGSVRKDYGLTVSGLMCIPPLDGPRGPYFALLKKIAERNGIRQLSMGMSDDFETAIAFGSTEIRVGSAIFGAR
ncbi:MULTISPECIES: YggS family pyridoxal phosphate-dependent enzyme [Asticcacaulis]|uniref:YggS family pyridoxal phosphate-dependent enzyme n=1 Tax=Asticcacaulis TaxID=76890 RepID=UPI001AE5F163|nr:MULTISPECIES: YggS family pyridoxal phosphate-dependent enzyme [Asticcacaulis]MBP2159918.1 pyridoxal phosphate enzyme (YggS family) [Asticcacaulis solisilvae]MDR6800963.1 pyridoxal phosphate enzyme (YggS family) [Asticcacaulis sp. BE141]